MACLVTAVAAAQPAAGPPFGDRARNLAALLREGRWALEAVRAGLEDEERTLQAELEARRRQSSAPSPAELARRETERLRRETQTALVGERAALTRREAQLRLIDQRLVELTSIPVQPTALQPPPSTQQFGRRVGGFFAIGGSVETINIAGATIRLAGIENFSIPPTQRLAQIPAFAGNTNCEETGVSSNEFNCKFGNNVDLVEFLLMNGLGRRRGNSSINSNHVLAQDRATRERLGCWGQIRC